MVPRPHLREFLTKGATRRRLFVQIGKSAILIAIGVVATLLIMPNGAQRSNLSVSELRHSGIADAQKGTCLSAIPILSEITSQYPHDYLAREYLGNCYLQVQNFDAAVSELEAVTVSQPTLTNETNLANAAFNSGYDSLGDNALSAALADSQSPANYLTLASSAIVYGDLSLATESLNKIPFEVRTYAWYSYRSQIQLELGYPSAAVSAAITAVNVAPGPLKSSQLVNLAETYSSVGQYQLSVSSLLRAISLHGHIDTTSTYNDLANSYIQLGNYTQALEASKEGIEISVGNFQPQLLLDEATALAYLQYTSRAITLLNELVSNESAPSEVAAEASSLLGTING